MIILDASETRSTSRMPEIPGAVVSDCLEETCGGDAMVTLKRFPASSPALIRKHIEAGAIIIQFKFGSDLLSSITDERINISLARMIEAGTKHQYQRMVISCGLYLPDVATGKTLVGRIVKQSRGKAVIQWRSSEPEIDYKSLATVRRRIALRGGVFLNLTCDEEVVPELRALENDLEYLASQRDKELLHLPKFPPDPPDPGDPLQIPIEVKDARVVIAAHRGVGPKKTNDLWTALREHNARVLEGTDVDPEPTLIQAMSWIWECNRDWAVPKKVYGWGDKSRQSVREQWGLLPNQDMCVRNNWEAEESDG